ncbi:hypothetical protein L873DRAFT_1809068 [Choiromyces venosus 120613-1]|uniref:Uncharacterized protein n=1 Tax=Choiromyces venosus 120613-1 TaxID=1336337 RepID=A0A3N4JNF3_9PEZI|nr:hypothetical protein L873DRAFT_1809068 [Choiromyces venosus 120613-1]
MHCTALHQKPTTPNTTVPHTYITTPGCKVRKPLAQVPINSTTTISYHNNPTPSFYPTG